MTRAPFRSTRKMGIDWKESKMTVAAILGEKGGNIISAGPDTSLQEIAKTLASNRIGAIIILEKDGSVCGIASERDVVRQVAQQGNEALRSPVSVCMTRKVVSCSPDQTIDEVMGIMTRNKFRHIPVTSENKLVGIISIGDVVKRKIEQAERDAEEMKRYIAG
jgi:CBS domain-containing protein